MRYRVAAWRPWMQAAAVAQQQAGGRIAEADFDHGHWKVELAIPPSNVR